MEEDKAGNEETVQEDGNHFMKIKCKFDAEAVDRIARTSEAESVKGAANYLQIPFIGGAKGFRCEIIDDCAFFAGNLCKKHFRLYEMAVEKESQRNGYGSFMIHRMKKLCKENGIGKITCRTSKQETAIMFYKKHGGIIVGEKDGDYEVEIKV